MKGLKFVGHMLFFFFVPFVLLLHYITKEQSKRQRTTRDLPGCRGEEGEWSELKRLNLTRTKISEVKHESGTHALFQFEFDLLFPSHSITPMSCLVASLSCLFLVVCWWCGLLVVRLQWNRMKHETNQLKKHNPENPPKKPRTKVREFTAFLSISLSHVTFSLESCWGIGCFSLF